MLFKRRDKNVVGTLLIAVVGVSAITTIAQGSVYTTAKELYPLTAPAGLTTPTPGYPGASLDYEQMIAEGQTVGGGFPTGGSDPQALLWSATNGTPTDIQPSNISGEVGSLTVATDGTNQVGYSYGTSQGMYKGFLAQHATLWSSTASSPVDLHPANLLGVGESNANGVFGNQQVGSGQGSATNDNAHALLWTGTAQSAVDLNPTLLAFTSSQAFGTDGVQQVGFAANTTLASAHAILWSGTAESAVDLNPILIPSITSSKAFGVAGTQEIGWGSTASGTHAILWNGTAESAIDLTPNGFTNTFGTGTNGVAQIGDGYGTATNNFDHALLWTGSANSVVDLGAMLPADLSGSFSVARSIDASGNVFGIVGHFSNGVTNYEAVEWSPTVVPEPTTLVLLAAPALLVRRRSRTSLRVSGGSNA